MKKMILARMGFGPNPAVSMALKPHLNGCAMLCPAPGLIMTFFETESTEEKITQDLKETGAMFFIFPWEPTHFNLPQGLAEEFEAKCGTPTTTTPAAHVPTFDEVLDKVNSEGAESLTPEEKEILERGE